jgi:hypothetical protein
MDPVILSCVNKAYSLMAVRPRNSYELNAANLLFHIVAVWTKFLCRLLLPISHNSDETLIKTDYFQLLCFELSDHMNLIPRGYFLIYYVRIYKVCFLVSLAVN